VPFILIEFIFWVPGRSADYFIVVHVEFEAYIFRAVFRNIGQKVVGYVPFETFIRQTLQSPGAYKRR